MIPDTHGIRELEFDFPFHTTFHNNIIITCLYHRLQIINMSSSSCTIYTVDRWSSETLLKDVSSSLNDIITRGSEVFGFTTPVRVVEESDGTVVDDENYFQTLLQSSSANLRLMLLTDDEDWKPPDAMFSLIETFWERSREDENAPEARILEIVSGHLLNDDVIAQQLNQLNIEQ